MAFGIRLWLKRDNKKLAARELADRETLESGSGDAAVGGRTSGFRYVL